MFSLLRFCRRFDKCVYFGIFLGSTGEGFSGRYLALLEAFWELRMAQLFQQEQSVGFRKLVLFN
jgi:hypothetical protein